MIASIKKSHCWICISVLSFVGVVLEKNCKELMMLKFGRLVNLETLQALSGNRTLEELKQQKFLRELADAKEIKHWDVR